MTTKGGAIPRTTATSSRKRGGQTLGKVGGVNHSNHSSRLRLRENQSGLVRNPSTVQNSEKNKRGLCPSGHVATVTQRRPSSLNLVAASMVLFASVPAASAQLGYDPFANNVSHTEASWARYVDATTNGTNRPSATFINGVNSTTLNATSFNLGVTAPDPSGAFVTSGGNIYSFSNAYTLTLSSNFAPVAGTFNTVVFSAKVLGNPLDLANVVLTPSGGASIAPSFTTVSTSGSGMGEASQYAFQFDLAGWGGSNNFTITLPGSASSVSFSSSQLDATTTTYGAQSVVPEPGNTTLMVLGGFGLLWSTQRLRRRQTA